MVFMDPQFLESLCSPGDLRPLRVNNGHLETKDGRIFPIRNGIPAFAGQALSARSRFWQTFYDFSAFAYDPTLGLADRLGIGSEQRIRANVLARINLAPGSLIVDVGCGTGASRAAFAPKDNYLGIDISFNMLRRAQAKCAKQGWRTNFIQAHAGALPLRSKKADLILAMGVLQHLPYPALALQEIARVAANNARILLIDEQRFLRSLLRRLGQPIQSSKSSQTITQLGEWCQAKLNLRWSDQRTLGEYFILDLNN